MSKFDFSKTISKIQNSFKRDERRANQIGLGNSLESISTDPEDYVVLPSWFSDNFGIMGLRFGHFIQIAGEPDSGKTSFSLLAIKAAQEQGYGVIYVETEGKTGVEDLESAGIDPNGVITIHTKITEEAFDGANRAIDIFFNDFPKAKLLLIFDSYGNTISMRDSEIDLTQSSQLVGGAAKTNRTGVSAIAAKQIEHPIAVLVVNYTYDNIGSPGKKNAGGKALDFHCMLIIQSSRKSWYEKIVDKVKVRAGANVLWKTYKNHYAKSLKNEDGTPKLLPKEAIFRISSVGFEFVQGSLE